MANCEQSEFGFTNWGGKRRGAGRKPQRKRSGVEHVARPKHTARIPVHLTLRLLPGLPSMRRPVTHAVLQDALVAGTRSGLRVVHYSVQSNHLHLIGEVSNERDLSLAMQGLTVRTARALNRHWGRKGSVFDGRYHVHALNSPGEVRNALRYVLQNAGKRGALPTGVVDRYSSARWFDGWRISDSPTHGTGSPLPRARSWLLVHGWRRAGLLKILDPR